MALFNHRYTIVKPLGGGATASVYLASDALYDNALVAIKIFSRKYLQASDVKNLENEFLTLREMEHPNLVRVFDYGRIVTSDSGEHLDNPYFTLEYVEGRSLLEATENASWEQIAEIFYQLGHALSYIHRCGLIHGDLKPENILVTETVTEQERLPFVKIIDFGFVSTADRKPLEELRGTMPYLAPELITGQQFDHRIDLYALGVTLYQVLARRLPYEEKDVLHLLKDRLLSPPPPVTSLRPDTPQVVAQLVERLIEKEPGVRGTDAAEVSHTLRAFTPREHILLELVGSVHLKKVIGREAEYSALLDLFAPLRAKDTREASLTSPRVAALIGETGIGKTSILEHLQRTAQVEEIPFVYARSSALRSSATQLLHETLKHLFFALLATTGEGTQLFNRFRSLFRAIAPELFFEGSEEEARESSMQELPSLNISDAYIRLLQAAATVRPFVLCIDDVEALDKEGQSALRYAAGALADHRAVVLLSSDSEAAVRSILGTAIGNARMIMVKGLPEEGIQEMMNLMLQSERIPDDIARRVREEVGGSPYILKEFLSQFLALPSDERLAAVLKVMDRPDASRALPKTVQEAYSEVFSSLKPEERYVISAVSCFRDGVPRTLLRHICPYSPDRLDHFLTRLMKREILSAAGGGKLCRFSQARFHRYVFESLGEMKRELHVLIAQKLEELGGEPEELAFHFHQADESERAYEYYLRAAEKAKLASAFKEQIQFLDEARELAPEREKQSVLELLAEGYARTGQHHEAIEIYLSLLEQPLLPAADKRRCLMALGVSQTELGRMDEGGKALLQAASLSQSGEEQREIEENLASLELARGNYRQARAHCLRVLQTLGSQKDSPRHISALNTLGVISFYESKFDDAIQYFTRTLELVETSGKKDRVTTVHINLGNVFSSQERFEDARRHWLLALSLCQEVGSLEQEAQIYNNLGIAHYSEQRHADALQCYERSLDLFERTGNLPGQAYCQTNLGEVYLAESAFEKALSAWEQALHLYEGMEDTLGQTETCNQLALVYLIIGNAANAGACIDRAAYYIEQRGIESQRGAHYFVNGISLTQQGEFESARRLLERAVDFFEAAHEERQRCAARLRLGILEEAAGRNAAALSILQEVAVTAQEKNFNDLAAHALLMVGTMAKGDARTEGREPLTTYKQAFALLKDQPVSDITWTVCVNLGKAYLQRGLNERGREYLAIAASALRHLVSGFTREDLRSCYLATDRRGATEQEIRSLLGMTPP